MNDTEKLLRETDAGCKMAVASIEDVIDRVENENLHKLLKETLESHKRLGDDVGDMLREYGEEGKDPNPIAKGMATVKVDMKMMMNATDHTVATLMMDGCNMGIQKLAEYVNKYKNADKRAQDFAKRLIDAEDKFMEDLRAYV